MNRCECGRPALKDKKECFTCSLPQNKVANNYTKLNTIKYTKMDRVRKFPKDKYND